MILKPCPFCHKDIPRSIQVCPYCHRNEQGKTVQIDSAENVAEQRQDLEAALAKAASEDPIQRDAAIEQLTLKGDRVVPDLLKALTASEKKGRPAIIRALGRIKDKRAIPLLSQSIRSGDEDVRLASIWALGQFRDHEALPALTAEAEKANPLLQPYLAYVLGEFRDPEAIPVLSKLLKSRDVGTAFQAAWALGEIPDKRAGKFLKVPAHSPDALLRAASRASLKKLGVSAVSGSSMGWWAAGMLLALAGVAILLFLRH